MTRKTQGAKRKPRAVHARVEPHALDALDTTAPGVFWLDLSTLRPFASRVKRVIDVIGSVIAVLLFSPLFLLIAVAIKLSSRGPVVFRQERVGFRCNPFAMYKFRTMYVGAELSERELAQREGKAFLKLAEDPRVTPLGRILRKFSLDEIPQFFNVLEGTMSLVGPRPLLLSDLSKFARRSQMRRFSVKPGITGLWQVSGRSKCTDEERMALDRRYVDEWSLLLDFKILVRTVLVVFSARDAF